MPRLSDPLLRQAYAISPYLPLLLRATRDLDFARIELRWLREHLSRWHRIHDKDRLGHSVAYRARKPASLAALCRQRATGMPLQYILGSQPFCDVEVLCRRGVLIPRPETDIYTTRLAYLLQLHRQQTNATDTQAEPLRILDLCAGTGCIGLGLLSQLQAIYPRIHIRAVDINPLARSTALKTVKLNQRLGRLPSLDLSQHQYEYILQDVLSPDAACHMSAATDVRSSTDAKPLPFDIIIANPPYISLSSFSRDTSRSARCFEPRNALVPPQKPTLPRNTQPAKQWRTAAADESGDIFYGPILRLAAHLATYQQQQGNPDREPKILLMEVSDLQQARRIMKMVRDIEAEGGGHKLPWDVKQIWCDEIDIYAHDELNSLSGEEGDGVDLIGTGHGRAVVLGRGWGGDVLRCGEARSSEQEHRV